ncbi:MAG: Aspartate/prephenate aminotransferase [Chroococcopsis gigantea SAG 12.99]|jgi:aspartate/methionine/tyrosine aminotransferase|nr:Aspartate/prephenate aminotransferase [Chroococcopsis gigantea SAG 12.99]
MFPNSRMEAVQSPIIPIVGQLILDNPGTISLGQGVVYWNPPLEAINEIENFLAAPNNHKYKAVAGITPLVERIREKLREDNGVGRDQQGTIVVTAGSNMGFMNALLAITSAGDEIVLNTPYYFNHEMGIRMADCQPVLVSTDENYQLRVDGLEAAITPKTKAIVTISPNNPTGVVYSQATLREVNQLCRERGIYHIHDEAYEYFTYNGVKSFSPISIEGSRDHTIGLYSLSKAYGFASWRIGYMVIPPHLFTDINKIQDTIVICPPVISQYAAIGALNAGRSYCGQHLETLAQVRGICLAALEKIQVMSHLVYSEGAFYFFLKLPGRINDFELVKELILKHRVAVLPGSTFGMNDGCYLRVAYGALQPETAAEGINRLVTGLNTIFG